MNLHTYPFAIILSIHLIIPIFTQSTNKSSNRFLGYISVWALSGSSFSHHGEECSMECVFKRGGE